MITALQRCVAALWRRLLERHVSPETYQLRRVERGKRSFAQLQEQMLCRAEYMQVIAPLLEEIYSTFRTFLFRDPTPQETAKSIRHFYEAYRTCDRRAEAIQRGDVRTHLGIRPLKLEMDVVNQCNLRCTMCHFSGAEYSFSRRPKREMPVEDFARIAEQLFPLCSHVSLSISTEPLLHQKLGELLQITAGYKLPFVYMHTNGLLLNERIIDHVMQSKVNQLSISIDGASKATYERIRIGARFERLIANIQALNRVKKRLRSATPHLCVNVVLMRSNIRELPALVRLAHEMQLEAIGAVHMVPLAIAVANPKEESLQWDKDLCNRMLDEARTLAERYRIHISLPDRFGVAEHFSPLIQVGTQHRDLSFLPPQPKALAQPGCLFPWHFVGLDSDGNLMPCGWWHHQAPLGNVLRESFAVIWNNEQYRKLRSEHLHGKLRHVCQTCPAAGMGNINHANAFLVR